MSELKLCSKEIAIQLKELEFDWDCEYYYNNKDILIKQFNYCYDNPIDYICAAPTQALVCKWFRDTKQIEIHIFKSDIGWCFQLEDSIEVDNNNEPFTLCNSYAGYKNYEQAEEAGIFKAIEIFKNKNK